MKNTWWMILTAVAILFSACAGPSKKPTSRNRFGSGAARTSTHVEQDRQFVGEPQPSPSPTSEPGTEAQTTPSPNVERSPAPTTSPPPPSTTSAPSGEMPYATPVPGKPGLVTSPFAPYAGYVDVRGYPPGQEVKCPYTGKLFRVP
jgi:hypothetical protein